MRKLLSFSLLALLGLAAAACEEQPMEPESSQTAQVEPWIDAPLSGASVVTTTEARQMMKSSAPFKTWSSPRILIQRDWHLGARFRADLSPAVGGEERSDEESTIYR